MKNINKIIFAGIFIGLVIFLWKTLTYIDPCECLRGYEGYGLRKNLTISERDKCVNLYGKNIPDSYKGSNKFSNQMIINLRSECN